VPLSSLKDEVHWTPAIYTCLSRQTFRDLSQDRKTTSVRSSPPPVLSDGCGLRFPQRGGARSSIASRIIFVSLNLCRRIAMSCPSRALLWLHGEGAHFVSPPPLGGRSLHKRERTDPSSAVVPHCYAAGIREGGVLFARNSFATPAPLQRQIQPSNSIPLFSRKASFTP